MLALDESAPLGEIEGIPIVDVPMFWRKLTEIP
jgi:hypothetical protein